MIPKLGISEQKKPMHYSVGALIKRNNKYLLINRAKPPFGFAGIAGHINEEEKPSEALIREVKEEGGLKVIKYSLLFEEELDWNWCNRGIGIHHWYLFKCEVSGKIKRDVLETKSIGWFSKSEIKKLNLEPVWKYWFEKIKMK